MARKLPNYLRTYRRRAGLTQRELAFLLGCSTPAKISRYEHFFREPSLNVLLAYNAIFKIPLSDLFNGTYLDVEQNVAKRAQKLIEKLNQSTQTKKVLHKTKLLGSLSSVVTNANPV